MQTSGHRASETREERRGGALLRSTEGLRLVIDLISRVIAVVCLSATFLALLVNVVLRYFFGSGISWAYEIHAILLPWLVAGGIVIASAQGRHIAITLLPDLLGPASKRAALLIIQALVLLISASVLWSSTPIIAASRFQRLSTFGITQIWGYASLVYVFAGLAVIAVLDILRLLAGGGNEPHSVSSLS